MDKVNEQREMEELNELDELIETLGRWIMEDEAKIGVLNPMWFKRFQFAHGVIKQLTEGTDMKVTYAVHQPFREMGYICVEAESLEFLNCKWLARAIEFATNVEVYPMSNGMVRLVLTFHGLVKGIE